MDEKALINYVLTREKAPVFPGGRPLDPEEARRLAEPWLEAMERYFADQGRKGGRIGGKSRSVAKVRAARENGSLGGRPKGSKKKEKTNVGD